MMKFKKIRSVVTMGKLRLKVIPLVKKKKTNPRENSQVKRKIYMKQ